MYRWRRVLHILENSKFYSRVLHISHTVSQRNICLNVFQMVNPVCLPCTVKTTRYSRFIHILHTVSYTKWSKFNLKIPAHEWQHGLQSNLSQIHSYHGGKTKQAKKIATCLNSVSPRICCEQAAAGMLRAFPVHFVPFQSNSRHCNMHGSCAATENWMQCGISLIHSFGKIIVNWHILSRSTWNLCTSIHQNAAR